MGSALRGHLLDGRLEGVEGAGASEAAGRHRSVADVVLRSGRCGSAVAEVIRATTTEDSLHLLHGRREGGVRTWQWPLQPACWESDRSQEPHMAVIMSRQSVGSWAAHL